MIKNVLEFNGSASLVNCGSHALLDNLHDDAFTIEAWVRADSNGETNGGVIASKTDVDSQNGWIFRIGTQNNLVGQVFCATTDAYANSQEGIVDGQWHHVAMTWDDTTSTYPQLWIDGVEVTYVSTVNRSGAVVSDSGNNFYIGNVPAADQTWDGAMAWLRASEVVRYSDTFTPPPIDLPPTGDTDTAEQWNFDEGRGSTATAHLLSPDSDGTITNGTWATIDLRSFSELITHIQNILNDTGASTWSTAQLAYFLNDAIRDYSQHFPRLIYSTLSLTTNTHGYSIPANFLSIIRVEYPTGQDPKEYLSRRSVTHPQFWSEDGYYDIISRSDATTNPSLVISTDPTTGETAAYEYNAYHPEIANPASISGYCTIPPYHQHLLVKYVQWQAALFLASAEQQTPTSNSSLLMAQLAQNARRLALDYSTALQQASYAADGESRAVSWITTGHDLDRIY